MDVQQTKTKTPKIIDTAINGLHVYIAQSACYILCMRPRERGGERKKKKRKR